MAGRRTPAGPGTAGSVKMALLRRTELGRLAVVAAVMTLLAVGFAGYLHPDLRLDLATLAQWCGLR